MSDDRLITVAIHTYDKAVALKNLLEHEGVAAVLQNVNLSAPVVSSGVRVRIKESDLPLALRIIENYDIFIDNAAADSEHLKTVLVPIDFSDYSLRAAKVAFDVAARHSAKIVLLHSFINPALSKRLQLTEALSFEFSETQEIARILIKEAKDSMDKFESAVKLLIKNGELPPVKFSSEIHEGVPEDVIRDTAKRINPMLIVMGTRGAERKEEELIGSVTAELLDSCRYAVLTVPEGTTLRKITDFNHIIFFSNLEQEDILAMEQLYRLFKDLAVEITIAHIPGKKDRHDSHPDAIESLLRYCRQHYPGFSFKVEHLRLDSVIEDFKHVALESHVNLIVLPNKKRNVFVRFFNPSLAHRLLLHADVPMLVIPV